MRAIVARSLGPPDVLDYVTHPDPHPGPGQVLVRIHAIGINFYDTERRRGLSRPVELPWIPGDQGAGVVEALGPGAALAVIVGEMLPLGQAAEAHRRLEARATQGKLILLPDAA
jgi:NADPH2:quinone reductase